MVQPAIDGGVVAVPLSMWSKLSIVPLEFITCQLIGHHPNSRDNTSSKQSNLTER